MPGDGVFAVGRDVKPGTYKSLGPASPGLSCGWYWRSSLGGTSSDNIIDLGSSSGPQYVRIAPTDAAFESVLCQPWVLVSP
jgi:hypothetical protein